MLKKKKAHDLDRENLPLHVGIIMDGNGRWAKKRMLPRVAGHRAAMKNVKKAIRFSSDNGIRVLTLYAFSTENWKRPKDEVSALMSILLEYLGRELEEMHEKGIVVRTIGDITGLPRPVQDLLCHSMEKTKSNKGMVLNLALNYGCPYGDHKRRTQYSKGSCKRTTGCGWHRRESICKSFVHGRCPGSGPGDTDERRSASQ